jgi:hypothetical protein
VELRRRSTAPSGLLERLTNWADMPEREGLVTLSTYRREAGIVSLLPRLAIDNAGLVTVYNDIKCAYVQFWRSAFERRATRRSDRACCRCQDLGMAR